MPIYRGLAYTRTFLFTKEDGSPEDITGWEFLSDVKAKRDDPDPPLVILSTANGGWTVSDGAGGKLTLLFSALQTPLLLPAKVIFDCIRTDNDIGPLWIFEATVPVKNPVTHVP